MSNPRGDLRLELYECAVLMWAIKSVLATSLPLEGERECLEDISAEVKALASELARQHATSLAQAKREGEG